MMDLAAVLVILVVVTGAIWVYDRVFLLKKRQAQSEQTGKTEQELVPAWIDLPRSLFPIFLLVLVLRSFVVEPFRIPSGSMMPTLLIGDFILVNKFSYGLRLPVLNTKVVDLGQPERGDVVVFRYPVDPAIPFIKRVVGLPGDELVYNNMTKTLFINGEAVSKTDLGVYQGLGAGSSMTGARQFNESLGEVKHDILVWPNRLDPGPYERVTVPQGHYFVFGDNRDNSRDSRYWGFVPEENLVGKAFFIWMYWDWSNGGIDLGRIGRTIQ